MCEHLVLIKHGLHFSFFLIPKLAEWERLTENFEVSRKRIASGYVTVYCLRVHAFINGEWCLCVHVGQETRKPAADGMPDPNQRRLKRFRLNKLY